MAVRFGGGPGFEVSITPNAALWMDDAVAGLPPQGSPVDVDCDGQINPVDSGIVHYSRSITSEDAD